MASWPCLAHALSPALPGTPEIEAFETFVRHFNLADEAIGLEAKQGDGSSAYFKIKVQGRTWGAILPDNSGNLVYGEILSFNLARALGHPELCGPAALHVLEGRELARFEKAMREARFDGDERLENQRTILQQIQNQPEYLETVLKQWGPKPYDVDFLTTPDDRFNTQDRWAALLRAEGPQPAAKMISLPGVPGEAPERELAAQLSTIFLIDMLAGQADRFSQGNINAIVRDGRVSFVAYDNGGTWDEGEFLKLYQHWLTRFDRRAAEAVLAMNEFLNGHGTSFLAFTNRADLQRAMGLETEDDLWKKFRQRLQIVAHHIRRQKGDCFFR